MRDMGKRRITPRTYKYWERLLSWIFRYRSRCYSLARPIQVEEITNSCADLKEFAFVYQHYSIQRGLICNVTKEPEDLALTKRLFCQVCKEITNPKICELVTAEIIAKVLAYRTLELDEEIPIPTLTKNGSVTLVTYVVSRVFDLWNRVTAYGLQPKKEKEAAPMLLFRGTDLNLLSESGRSSILSDFDPDGPGRSLYEHAAETIHYWLETVCAGKQRARVYGHSLGGAFATYAIIHEHAHISTKPHEPSYAFNFPGVSKELIEAWEAIPETKRPHFTGFVARGDLISKFGSLFGEVFELSLQKRLRPILAHEQLYFSQPLCYLQPVDIERENSDTSRQLYSKIQQGTARAMYNIGLKYLFPHKE